MPPMTCYVVTSLENRARAELAARDIERLRAAGAFDAGEDAARAGGAGADGDGARADADAADGKRSGCGAGEGRGAGACVLVAAQTMAAAEELVAQLDASVPVHIFDARVHLSFAEHVMLALAKRYAAAARVFARKLRPALAREARALLDRAREDFAAGGLHGEGPGGAAGGAAPAAVPEFGRIVFLEAHNEYLVHVFSAAGLPVDVLVHEGLPGELGAIAQAQRLLGFKAARICGVSLEDARLSEEARASALDGTIAATLLGRRAWLDGEGFHFSGTIALKAVDGFGVPESLRIETAEGVVLSEADPAQWRGRVEAGRTTFTLTFAFALDAKQAENLPLDTKLAVAFEAGGLAGRSDICYCRRDFGKRGTGRVGKILVNEGSGTTCFLCQTAANFCQLVSRNTDPADMPAVRLRIRVAWALSKLSPAHENIVLWEKFSSRYEESARRVYERLVDEGDRRARFILDGDALNRELASGRIGPAYQAQLVRRCSFAYFHLVFSAKSFIGTETIAHLIGMHSSSRLVRRHVKEARFNYAFLQHGVMYMVTLGSAGRDFFASTSSKGLRRVVVSSEREKGHFVQSGGYAPEELYVCGLPKYDANAWDADADLIAVMPTWRPWEEGVARSAFTQTGYHRFLVGICEAVPERLRPKLRILIHPRFKACARYLDSPLAPYIVDETPYDEVLQRVKLLVTDYSSISFDAFYRGANVIFDWEELDECMHEYGPGTHLMLTRELAFGEVYDGEKEAGPGVGAGSSASVCGECDGPRGAGEVLVRPKLRTLIERAYASGQSDEHLRRYRQIVSFHDGKNTERLMQVMRADGIV